jgi:AcrR family transcriptional regulator
MGSMKEDDRKRSILDAFDRLVERYGAEKVRVLEVADEVGVSVGTLYNDFGSKEGLFDSASERLQTSVLDFPEGATGGLSPRDELRALILGWIRALMDISFSRRVLLFRSLAPEKRAFPRRFHAGREIFRGRLAARIVPVLERGTADRTFEVADPIDTAARIVDAFSDYWLPLAFAERQSDEVMKNAESLLKIILAGISTR